MPLTAMQLCYPCTCCVAISTIPVDLLPTLTAHYRWSSVFHETTIHLSIYNLWVPPASPNLTWSQTRNSLIWYIHFATWSACQLVSLTFIHSVTASTKPTQCSIVISDVGICWLGTSIFCFDHQRLCKLDY
jgi:hypothetical protein